MKSIPQIFLFILSCLVGLAAAANNVPVVLNAVVAALADEPILADCLQGAILTNTFLLSVFGTANIGALTNLAFTSSQRINVPAPSTPSNALSLPCLAASPGAGAVQANSLVFTNAVEFSPTQTFSSTANSTILGTTITLSMRVSGQFSALSLSNVPFTIVFTKTTIIFNNVQNTMPVLQPATWRGSLVPSGSAPYLLDDDLFDGSMPLLVRGAGNRNFAGLRSWSTLENNFLLPSGVGPLGRLLARLEYFMTSLASHPSGQFASVRGLFLPINLENLSFVDNTLLGSSSALNLQAPIAGIPIGGSSTLALGDGTLLRVENSCQGTTECASLLPTMRFFLNDRFGARCPQLSIVPETLSATTAFAFFFSTTESSLSVRKLKAVVSVSAVCNAGVLPTFVHLTLNLNVSSGTLTWPLDFLSLANNNNLYGVHVQLLQNLPCNVSGFASGYAVDPLTSGLFTVLPGDMFGSIPAGVFVQDVALNVNNVGTMGGPVGANFFNNTPVDFLLSRMVFAQASTSLSGVLPTLSFPLPSTSDAALMGALWTSFSSTRVPWTLTHFWHWYVSVGVRWVSANTPSTGIAPYAPLPSTISSTTPVYQLQRKMAGSPCLTWRSLSIIGPTTVPVSLPATTSPTTASTSPNPPITMTSGGRLVLDAVLARVNTRLATQIDVPTLMSFASRGFTTTVAPPRLVGPLRVVPGNNNTVRISAVIVNTNFTNLTLIGGTVTNCTGLASTLTTNVVVNSSTLFSSILLANITTRNTILVDTVSAVNSTLNFGAIYNSTISSSALNSLFVHGSVITNATLFNVTVINCTLLNCIVTDSLIINSTLVSSRLTRTTTSPFTPYYTQVTATVRGFYHGLVDLPLSSASCTNPSFSFTNLTSFLGPQLSSSVTPTNDTNTNQPPSGSAPAPTPTTDVTSGGLLSLTFAPADIQPLACLTALVNLTSNEIRLLYCLNTTVTTTPNTIVDWFGPGSSPSLDRIYTTRAFPANANPNTGPTRPSTMLPTLARDLGAIYINADKFADPLFVTAGGLGQWRADNLANALALSSTLPLTSPLDTVLAFEAAAQAYSVTNGGLAAPQVFTSTSIVNSTIQIRVQVVTITSVALRAIGSSWDTLIDTDRMRIHTMLNTWAVFTLPFASAVATTNASAASSSSGRLYVPNFDIPVVTCMQASTLSSSVLFGDMLFPSLAWFNFAAILATEQNETVSALIAARLLGSNISSTPISLSVAPMRMCGDAAILFTDVSNMMLLPDKLVSDPAATALFPLQVNPNVASTSRDEAAILDTLQRRSTVRRFPLYQFTACRPTCGSYWQLNAQIGLATQQQSQPLVINCTLDPTNSLQWTSLAAITSSLNARLASACPQLNYFITFTSDDEVSQADVDFLTTTLQDTHGGCACASLTQAYTLIIEPRFDGVILDMQLVSNSTSSATWNFTFAPPSRAPLAATPSAARVFFATSLVNPFVPSQRFASTTTSLINSPTLNNLTGAAPNLSPSRASAMAITETTFADITTTVPVTRLSSVIDADAQPFFTPTLTAHVFPLFKLFPQNAAFVTENLTARYNMPFVELATTLRAQVTLASTLHMRMLSIPECLPMGGGFNVSVFSSFDTRDCPPFDQQQAPSNANSIECSNLSASSVAVVPNAPFNTITVTVLAQNRSLGGSVSYLSYRWTLTLTPGLTVMDALPLALHASVPSNIYPAFSVTQRLLKMDNSTQILLTVSRIQPTPTTLFVPYSIGIVESQLPFFRPSLVSWPLTCNVIDDMSANFYGTVQSSSTFTNGSQVRIGFGAATASTVDGSSAFAFRSVLATPYVPPLAVTNAATFRDLFGQVLAGRFNYQSSLLANNLTLNPEYTFNTTALSSPTTTTTTIAPVTSSPSSSNTVVGGLSSAFTVGNITTTVFGAPSAPDVRTVMGATTTFNVTEFSGPQAPQYEQQAFILRLPNISGEALCAEYPACLIMCNSAKALANFSAKAREQLAKIDQKIPLTSSNVGQILEDFLTRIDNTRDVVCSGKDFNTPNTLLTAREMCESLYIKLGVTTSLCAEVQNFTLSEDAVRLPITISKSFNFSTDLEFDVRVFDTGVNNLSTGLAPDGLSLNIDLAFSTTLVFKKSVVDDPMLLLDSPRLILTINCDFESKVLVTLGALQFYIAKSPTGAFLRNIALSFGYDSNRYSSFQLSVLSGAIDLRAAINLPLDRTCNLEFTVKDLGGYLATRSPSTYSLGSTGCIGDGLLRALLQATFTAYLYNLGSLRQNIDREWSKFTKIAETHLTNANIPFIGREWIMMFVSDLREVFGNLFFKALNRVIRSTLANTNDSPSAATADSESNSFLAEEARAMAWFVNQTQYLMFGATVKQEQVQHLNQLANNITTLARRIKNFTDTHANETATAINTTRDLLNEKSRLEKQVTDLLNKGFVVPITITRTKQVPLTQYSFDLGSGQVAYFKGSCQNVFMEFTLSLNISLNFTLVNGTQIVFPPEPYTGAKFQAYLNTNPGCIMEGALGLLGVAGQVGSRVLGSLSLYRSTNPARPFTPRVYLDGYVHVKGQAGMAGYVAQLLGQTTGNALMRLPNFLTTFNCSYHCDGASCGSAPVCVFSDLRLCAGDYLDGVVGRILNVVNNGFLRFLMEFINVITYPIPPLSMLVGRSISLVDLAEWIYDSMCTGFCVFDGVFESINALRLLALLYFQIRNIANAVGRLRGCHAFTLNLETFTINFAEPDLLPKKKLFTGWLNDPANWRDVTYPYYPATVEEAEGMLGALDEGFPDPGPYPPGMRPDPTVSVVFSGSLEGQFKFDMPFLKDYAKCWADTIFGKECVLVEFGFPRLKLGVEVPIEIPVWPFPLIKVIFFVGLGAEITFPPLRLSSLSLSQAIKTRSVAKALWGLQMRATNNGVPINPIVAYFTLGAGVSVSVFFAKASLLFYLKLVGLLNLPKLHPNSDWITYQDFLNLLDFNGGSKWYSLTRTLQLRFGIRFKIKFCFVFWCATVVNKNWEWTLKQWTWDASRPPVLVRNQIVQIDYAHAGAYSLLYVLSQTGGDMLMLDMYWGHAARTAVGFGLLTFNDRPPITNTLSRVGTTYRSATTSQSVSFRAPTGDSAIGPAQPISGNGVYFMIMGIDTIRFYTPPRAVVRFPVSSFSSQKMFISTTSIAFYETFSATYVQLCDSLYITDTVWGFTHEFTGMPCTGTLAAQYTNGAAAIFKGFVSNYLGRTMIFSDSNRVPSGFSTVKAGFSDATTLWATPASIRLGETLAPFVTFDAPSQWMELTGSTRGTRMVLSEVPANSFYFMQGLSGQIVNTYEYLDLSKVLGTTSARGTDLAYDILKATYQPTTNFSFLLAATTLLANGPGANPDIYSVDFLGMNEFNFVFAVRTQQAGQVILRSTGADSNLNVASTVERNAALDYLFQGGCHPTENRFIQSGGDGTVNFRVGAGYVRSFGCLHRLVELTPSSTTAQRRLLIDASQDPNPFTFTVSKSKITIANDGTAETTHFIFDFLTLIEIHGGSGSNTVVLSETLSPDTNILISFRAENTASLGTIITLPQPSSVAVLGPHTLQVPVESSVYPQLAGVYWRPIVAYTPPTAPNPSSHALLSSVPQALFVSATPNCVLIAPRGDSTAAGMRYLGHTARFQSNVLERFGFDIMSIAQSSGSKCLVQSNKNNRTIIDVVLASEEGDMVLVSNTRDAARIEAGDGDNVIATIDVRDLTVVTGGGADTIVLGAVSEAFTDPVAVAALSRSSSWHPYDWNLRTGAGGDNVFADTRGVRGEFDLGLDGAADTITLFTNGLGLGLSTNVSATAPVNALPDEQVHTYWSAGAYVGDGIAVQDYFQEDTLTQREHDLRSSELPWATPSEVRALTNTLPVPRGWTPIALVADPVPTLFPGDFFPVPENDNVNDYSRSVIVDQGEPKRYTTFELGTNQTHVVRQCTASARMLFFVPTNLGTVPRPESWAVKVQLTQVELCDIQVSADNTFNGTVAVWIDPSLDTPIVVQQSPLFPTTDVITVGSTKISVQGATTILLQSGAAVEVRSLSPNVQFLGISPSSPDGVLIRGGARAAAAAADSVGMDALAQGAAGAYSNAMRSAAEAAAAALSTTCCAPLPVTITAKLAGGYVTLIDCSAVLSSALMDTLASLQVRGPLAQTTVTVSSWPRPEFWAGCLTGRPFNASAAGGRTTSTAYLDPIARLDTLLLFLGVASPTATLTQAARYCVGFVHNEARQLTITANTNATVLVDFDNRRELTIVGAPVVVARANVTLATANITTECLWVKESDAISISLCTPPLSSSFLSLRGYTTSSAITVAQCQGSDADPAAVFVLRDTSGFDAYVLNSSVIPAGNTTTTTTRTTTTTPTRATTTTNTRSTTPSPSTTTSTPPVPTSATPLFPGAFLSSSFSSIAWAGALCGGTVNDIRGALPNISFSSPFRDARVLVNVSDTLAVRKVSGGLSIPAAPNASAVSIVCDHAACVAANAFSVRGLASSPLEITLARSITPVQVVLQQPSNVTGLQRSIVASRQTNATLLVPATSSLLLRRAIDITPALAQFTPDQTTPLGRYLSPAVDCSSNALFLDDINRELATAGQNHRAHSYKRAGLITTIDVPTLFCNLEGPSARLATQASTRSVDVAPSTYWRPIIIVLFLLGLAVIPLGYIFRGAFSAHGVTSLILTACAFRVIENEADWNSKDTLELLAEANRVVLGWADRTNTGDVTDTADVILIALLSACLALLAVLTVLGVRRLVCNDEAPVAFLELVERPASVVVECVATITAFLAFVALIVRAEFVAVSSAAIGLTVGCVVLGFAVLLLPLFGRQPAAAVVGEESIFSRRLRMTLSFIFVAVAVPAARVLYAGSLLAVLLAMTIASRIAFYGRVLIHHGLSTERREMTRVIVFSYILAILDLLFGIAFLVVVYVELAASVAGAFFGIWAVTGIVAACFLTWK